MGCLVPYCDYFIIVTIDYSTCDAQRGLFGLGTAEVSRRARDRVPVPVKNCCADCAPSSSHVSRIRLIILNQRVAEWLASEPANQEVAGSNPMGEYFHFPQKSRNGQKGPPKRKQWPGTRVAASVSPGRERGRDRVFAGSAPSPRYFPWPPKAWRGRPHAVSSFEREGLTRPSRSWPHNPLFEKPAPELPPNRQKQAARC